MDDNVFVNDIFSQVDALKLLLEHLDLSSIDRLAQSLELKKFDRIILTGMGASYYSLYPAWIKVLQSKVPAIWVNTSELIHHASDLISKNTLLWIVSQSGKSAEIISLLNLLEPKSDFTVLAIVNDLKSSLAKSIEEFSPLSALVSIGAEEEVSVSTRTYMNSLAINQLAAKKLCGEGLSSHIEDLHFTVTEIESYLNNWHDHYACLEKNFPTPNHLSILGRGESLASVYTGALILGEAAKFPASSYQSAEFRHGPLELINKDLSVIVFSGPAHITKLNFRLFNDLVQLGVRAYWVSSNSVPDLPKERFIRSPKWLGIGLPLSEIIPMQLLTVFLADRTGVDVGIFNHIGKITKHE